MLLLLRFYERFSLNQTEIDTFSEVPTKDLDKILEQFKIKYNIL
jgi:hypothetical protein